MRFSYRIIFTLFQNKTKSWKGKTKLCMSPFQSKNGITTMASVAKDTRLVTADSAGSLLLQLFLLFVVIEKVK